MIVDRLEASSYRCEAAALLPEHTAVAGLLLTAAPRGHCFSETAAKSKAHSKRVTAVLKKTDNCK